MVPVEQQLTPGKSYLYAGDIAGLVAIVGAFDVVDQLEYDGSASDVKSARQLVASAQLRALGSKRLLLIKNAEQMSEAVQNTLLKLIEEPALSLVIIVATEQDGQLLPTVKSRLHRLGQLAPDLSAVSSSWLEGSVAEVFTKLSELPRESLVKLLASEMRYRKDQLFQEPDARLVKQIKLFDRAIKKLNANCNIKLTIDWLLLHKTDN